MHMKFIPMAIPSLGRLEEKLVQQCVKSSWISSSGEFIEKFENSFAEYFKVKHAISCANGTVALHLALLVLGIGPKDEVILPTLSFVATASILIFESRIKKLLASFPKIIKEDLSVTLAAQIGVAPIIFVTFGQFNLLSPLINVLVLWTIAPITIIAGISGIVGLVIPSLGKLLVYLSYPLTLWFVKVIEVFS